MTPTTTVPLHDTFTRICCEVLTGAKGFRNAVVTPVRHWPLLWHRQHRGETRKAHTAAGAPACRSPGSQSARPGPAPAVQPGAARPRPPRRTQCVPEARQLERLAALARFALCKSRERPQPAERADGPSRPRRPRPHLGPAPAPHTAPRAAPAAAPGPP